MLFREKSSSFHLSFHASVCLAASRHSSSRFCCKRARRSAQPRSTRTGGTTISFFGEKHTAGRDTICLKVLQLKEQHRLLWQPSRNTDKGLDAVGTSLSWAWEFWRSWVQGEDACRGAHTAPSWLQGLMLLNAQMRPARENAAGAKLCLVFED